MLCTLLNTYWIFYSIKITFKLFRRKYLKDINALWRFLMAKECKQFSSYGNIERSPFCILCQKYAVKRMLKTTLFTRQHQPEIVLGFLQNSNKPNFPKRRKQTVSWKDRLKSKGQTLQHMPGENKPCQKKNHICFQVIPIPALGIWVHSSPLRRAKMHTHYLKYDFDFPILAQGSRPVQ